MGAITINRNKEEKMEHPGSRELYDKVANWHPGPLFFSKTFGWERWGWFGILADYLLYYTPGSILEIGCCETSIFLSELAVKHGRQVYHCDIQRSIIENCKTVPGYFGPNSHTYVMSSDEFFKTGAYEMDLPVALAFIDGDHLYPQVRKDFANAFELLHPQGHIILHDTAPPSEEWIGETRCGTVYQLRREIEQDPGLEIFTFRKSAFDVGLSLVRRKDNGYQGE
jgi:hypothetical protein